MTVIRAAAAAPRPNVLFILCDDLRWNAMSCAGHPTLKTPHIDRMAHEGVRFANMFCTTSLCSPSRASILTGLYAHRHGVRDNFTELPAGLTHWPMRLRESGYETAYVGKWHMGENNDAPRPGFDYFATHKGQGKYNYKRQFPYTPNVRAVRTDDWKYIHYPHGDGSPDKHLAELYDLKHDPDERFNLIDDPRHRQLVAQMKAELARLMKASGLPPDRDRMPLDEGIRKELPDQKIR
jgi:N-acetylglucosamine-6-sulfatase